MICEERRCILGVVSSTEKLAGKTLLCAPSRVATWPYIPATRSDSYSKAIKHASQNQEGENWEYKIFSDNQAAIQRLQTPSDKLGQNYQIEAIEASKAIISRGGTVSIIWVPGHSDIIGNEEADRLAKQATSINSSSTPTSFAFLGIKINELEKSEIKLYLEQNKKSKSLISYASRYLARILSKIQLPSRTHRELTSSFF